MPGAASVDAQQIDNYEAIANTIIQLFGINVFGVMFSGRRASHCLIGEPMNNLDLSNLSRRNFVAVAGYTAAAVAFAPRFLFA